MSPTTARPGAGHGGVLRISLVYMVTAFVVFLLMGVLGLLMRLNHAGLLTLSEWFYPIMTLHGSGMVAANLLAAMGGFAAILGQSHRLSVRWLSIAFVIYFAGAGFVIVATAVGRFAGGWTALHPLPYEAKGGWSLWAALAMYVGYLFVAVGFFAYCLTILRALVSTYGGLREALAWRYLFSGGKDTREPLPGPVALVGMVVAFDGVVAVLAGALLLVPLFAQAAGLVPMVDALLAKNLLFLFGHTMVNINIYLSAGLVYATLPHYTGREWRTTWPVALALNLTIVLVLLPTFHHLYQDFAQPLPLQVLGQIASYSVAVPALVVTILGALSLIYHSGFRWSVPSILIALGLWGWTFGGMGAVLDATIGVNQIMHNTMWVPAHFHSYYLLGAVAFSWAYLYHLLVQLSRAEETPRSQAAAWLYGFGGGGFLLMFFLSGAYSVPRRYAAHLAEWQTFALVAVPFVLILGVGIGWLAIDMALRLGPAWRQTKVAA